MTFNASKRESTEVIQTPTSFEFESSRNTSRFAITANTLSKEIAARAVRKLKGCILCYAHSKTKYPNFLKPWKPLTSTGASLLASGLYQLLYKFEGRYF